MDEKFIKINDMQAICDGLGANLILAWAYSKSFVELKRGDLRIRLVVHLMANIGDRWGFTGNVSLGTHVLVRYDASTGEVDNLTITGPGSRDWDTRAAIAAELIDWLQAAA